MNHIASCGNGDQIGVVRYVCGASQLQPRAQPAKLTFHDVRHRGRCMGGSVSGKASLSELINR